MPENQPNPDENPILKASQENREKFLKELEKLTMKPVDEGRPLTDDESVRFEQLTKKINRLDKDIRKLREEEERKAKAAAAAAGIPEPAAVVRSEPMTYGPGSPYSFFRDMALKSAQLIEPSYSQMAAAATDRLARHYKEVEIEARRDGKLADRLREIRATPIGLLEQRTNPNTTAGTGGERFAAAVA